MDVSTALRVGMATARIKSIPELSKRTGIPQATLYKRVKEPSTMSLAEFREIVRTTRMSDELILIIAKEKK